jgi:ubiquitin carboxyl-terminal hydrolase L3
LAFVHLHMARVLGSVAAQPKWVPLESNPDLWNEYMYHLGVEGGRPAFVDVLSLTEAVAQLPQPVHALVVCFPLGAREASSPVRTVGSDVCYYFCAQTVQNACGTMALLHAVLNNCERASIQLRPSSVLEKLQAHARDFPNATPLERAEFLEGDEALAAAHDAYAAAGQTTAPAPDTDTDMHFICLIRDRSGRRLLELDGRKHGPVDHGETNAETFVEDACRLIQNKFVQRGPYLTVMALCG